MNGRTADVSITSWWLRICWCRYDATAACCLVTRLAPTGGQETRNQSRITWTKSWILLVWFTWMNIWRSKFPHIQVLTEWAQFHGSAYYKQIIGASRSTEFCACIKQISPVSREFWLVRVRSPYYQAFYAYIASVANDDCKRRIRRLAEPWKLGPNFIKLLKFTESVSLIFITDIWHNCLILFVVFHLFVCLTWICAMTLNQIKLHSPFRFVTSLL